MGHERERSNHYNHIDDDLSRAIETDGCPLPGVEVRIDDDGNTLPTGEIGRLLAQACSNWRLLGSTSMQLMPTVGSIPATSLELTIGIHPHHRSLKGRRHSWCENIPVVEIENLLYRHPSVAQVAIVAYPDERRANACDDC